MGRGGNEIEAKKLLRWAFDDPSGEDLEEPGTLAAMKPSPCAKPSAQASPPRVREVRYVHAASASLQPAWVDLGSVASPMGIPFLR
ncbi:MAG TPA: hypothetical protein VI094_21230 [Propionibacteriaceae bacterium]